MPRLSSVRTALVAWVETATGLTCVLSHASSPRPAKPYATVHMVTGLIRHGAFDELRPAEQDAVSTNAEIVGSREFTVSVNVFGADAHDYMRRLQDSAQRLNNPYGLKRRQVSKVTVTTAASATAYAVTINGEPVTITSGAGATKATIAAALVAAVNANLYVPVEAATSGTDALTLTGAMGADFTVAVGARLTIAEVTDALDLVIIGDGGVQDLTALLETAWEPRAQCDFFFLTATSFLDDLGAIEHVRMTNLDTGETITVDKGVPPPTP